jgi:hypothetical protein
LLLGELLAAIIPVLVLAYMLPVVLPPTLLAAAVTEPQDTMPGLA